MYNSFVKKVVKVGRHVKIKSVAANCKIAGKMIIFKPTDQLTEKVKRNF